MIFRSPYPEVSIPAVSLPSVVLGEAVERGARPALIDGPSGRTLTYAQLYQGVQAVAAGLAARGFSKGDVFAIFSPNLPEYAVAFQAVAQLGGIVTTVNPLYTREELAFQLKDSGARMLLTVPPFVETARAAAEEAGVEAVFVFGGAAGATPFAELLQASGRPPAVEIDPAEDLVALPYSSGTTGLPKGVMLTHRNLVANLLQMAGTGHFIRPEDVVMGVLPFFHIYGMTVILNAAVYVGATIVTLPRFDLEQFLGVIQKYRVTVANLVPPIVLGLAKHPLVEKYDLSSLRLIISGAAPLGADVAEACAQRVGCDVEQGYGLTETSPVTHVNLLNPDNHASIGPLVPNTECKIVDTVTDQELGPNERGEVWVRGPQVMKGYWNNPEATAATLDAEGWLHTGDVGYVDEDGFFYIVDRVKELIKYKGFQVAPAELEAVLLTHPAVADAAVIPSPDEEAGEVPKAFVVRKDEVSADALLTFVAERVAPYKKVREVEFVDQIPKSPSGKILRRVLVERERGRA